MGATLSSLKLFREKNTNIMICRELKVKILFRPHDQQIRYTQLIMSVQCHMYCNGELLCTVTAPIIGQLTPIINQSRWPFCTVLYYNALHYTSPKYRAISLNTPYSLLLVYQADCITQHFTILFVVVYSLGQQKLKFKKT